MPDLPKDTNLQKVSVVQVIGGTNLDIKARGIAPLVPGSSNLADIIMTPGGVARNVAENLGHLGVDTGLVSAVGRDAAGDMCVGSVVSAGVDASAVFRTNQPTGLYVAALEPDGEMLVGLNAMPALECLTVAALEPICAVVARAQFLFADCNLPAETVHWLKSLGPPLLVDPVSVAKAEKLRSHGLEGIFCLSLNRLQAESLTGKSIRTMADAITATGTLRRQGARHVVLSLGAEGACVDGKHLHPASVQGVIRDVTGAGDAANAGLIFGLLEGFSLLEAARLGQRAAALAITSPQSVSGTLTRAHLLSADDPGILKP